MFQNKYFFYLFISIIIVIGILAMIFSSLKTVTDGKTYDMASVGYYAIWIIAILSSGLLHKTIKGDHFWRTALIWCIIFLVLFFGYNTYKNLNEPEFKTPEHFNYDQQQSNWTI